MVEKGLFESFLLCRYYSLLGERGKWSKKGKAGRGFAGVPGGVDSAATAAPTV